MRFARLKVLAAVAVPLGMMGVFTASASAEGGPTCTGVTGKGKLSPGLTETAQIQTITINGKLSGCTGGATSAKYTVTGKTTEPVNCVGFAGGSDGANPLTIDIKWKGKGLGSSIGTFNMPLSGLPEVGISGMLESGPFAGSKLSWAVTEKLKIKGSCSDPPPKPPVVLAISGRAEN